MASNRHLARIAIMQTLFAQEFHGGNADGVFNYNLKEINSSLKDTDFALSVLHGIISKKEDIFKIIKEEAPQWPVDKIASVDRAILEIGIYEILFSKDVPPIVAINEAIELAKSFGDTNAPKFINGVLSTVMHKYSK